MKKTLSLIAALCALTGVAAAQDAPYLGRWALTPKQGGAGWLEVKAEGGKFTGSLLWIGGSPEALSSVWFDGNQLCALRARTDMVKDATGKIIGSEIHPLMLNATLSGGTLHGVFSEPAGDRKSVIKQEFDGVRISELPPAPDLKKVKFGKAVKLFNGKNLDGWVVFGGAHWAQVKDKKREAGAAETWVAKDDSVESGWSVKDGVLINNPVQEPGKPHIQYGNLATTREFSDFNITLDVSVDKGGNSGVYLRGIYEVQVEETYGQPVDPHHMGGVYARITPSVAAEKPAGEWQKLDITLVDRHVTVKLNGTLIIDNQPLMGCTGGALWSDESKPGPIYLQGDHSSVKYRNIVLRPVVKK